MIPVEDASQTSLHLYEKDYLTTMKLLGSETMGKLIGLFCHLAYHVVLGDVNPVPVEPLIKKQIFVNIMEQVQILKQSF